MSRWIARSLLPVERRREPGAHGARRAWVRVADVEAFAAWFYRNGPPPPWLDGRRELG